MTAIKPSRAKIVVVDDHPFIRRGLAEVLNHEEDLMVCGEADTLQGALEQVERVRPDVVVVDIALQGRSGLELIKVLRSRWPKIITLVLSMHDERLYAERTLRAGARGYLMKGEAAPNMLAAIRRVLSGDVYLSPQMNATLLSRLADGQGGRAAIDRLSDRELDVWRLIGQGRGTREIAEALHLSVKTIETHRQHIQSKLHLDTAAQLVQQAIQWESWEHDLPRSGNP